MFSNLYLQNTIAAVKQPFLASIALICVFANAQRLSFRPWPLIKTGVTGLVFTLVTLITLLVYFKYTVTSNPDAYASLIDKMVLHSPVPVIVETETPTPTAGERYNPLEKIVQKKEMVFAYRKNFEPFYFYEFQW